VHQDATTLSGPDSLRPLRLLLMLLVAFGAGFVIALTLGGSPAQADDQAPEEGSPRSVVGDLAGGLTATTGRVSTTVTTFSALSETLDDASVSQLVAPLTSALDLTQLVSPVVAPLLPTFPELGGSLLDPIDAVGASWVSEIAVLSSAVTALAAVEPFGLQGGGLPIGGSTLDGAAASGATAPAIAGLLGAAFGVLLTSVRGRSSDDATPPSATFDTDSSPD